MSRQHFEALAREIRAIENRDARIEAAVAVARAVAGFNNQFDQTRFFRACDVL
jgi:hypothetical protein